MSININQHLNEKLQKKTAVKIISGLNNFDIPSVSTIVTAASNAGATFLDIAASKDLILLARNLTKLPICVSAINFKEFVSAISHGVDMIEIGNFDTFYEQKRFFGVAEIFHLVERLRAKSSKTTLSVTIPFILPIHRALSFIELLKKNDLNLVQTEGGFSNSVLNKKSGMLNSIEKTSSTLIACHYFSKNNSTPILCSSNMNAITMPLASICGANGIGVGSAVNKLNSEMAMTAAIQSFSTEFGSSTFVVHSQMMQKKMQARVSA
uniref:Uncharacterized protein ycf23 n=1 Tax=Cyanoptyche gloeocystis TaxID=77922 RepID=A0A3G1IW81_9EUKA|nr:hypothetical protein [Cyanoptyche gloeocystis]|mmetsp:Transcript_5940/g.10182  ORF Transcript_5940/g.10182 Transcript_5940/m.10182 type:complete len:266 (-) Transcript_5940:491-1288(-)